MRLIGTLKNPQDAKRFSSFLQQQGIENKLDLISNTDWGSAKYGDQEVRVWVLDEDQFQKAMELLKRFDKDPSDSFFVAPKFVPLEIVPDDDTGDDASEGAQHSVKVKQEPTQILTLYFLISCILLFAASMMTIPNRERIAVPYPYTAIYSSEVTQGLLFDFPQAYEILENLVNTYGIKGLQDPSSMPEAGQQMLQKYYSTPYWQGYYDMLALRLQEKPYEAWETQSHWFEKIKQGEVWRLFSPALLHLDIFHLLFNMVWLVVLGRQLEQRLGAFRYLLFVVGIGIFANIAQYLMSGPNFLGFSGVLVGMFTFIWTRQRIAAWEGYQLQRSTVLLLGIFVIGLFLIQVASFFAEVYTGTAIAPMIANTAHLAGGFAGLVLGRVKFFAWKR